MRSSSTRREYSMQAPSRLTADGGRILLDGAHSASTIGRSPARLIGNVRSRERRRSIRPRARRSIGKNIARLDLPAKVAGGAFIHDLEMPGMIHGRVMRPPPVTRSGLESLDESAAARLPGVIKIWRGWATSSAFAASMNTRP